MSERRNPRHRPPDPAGTRPKVDPEQLRPAEPVRASGELSAAGEKRPSEEPPAPLHAALGPPQTSPGPSDAAPATPQAAPALPQPTVPLQAATAAPPRKPPASPPVTHAARFQFLFGALGALGVAAVALAALLAVSHRTASQSGLPWSEWSPSGDVDPAVQIAEHVAGEYALSPGHPLVSVRGGAQEIEGQPVVVAVRNAGGTPAALPENGVLYQMCGEGPNCSLPGKWSYSRGRLLQREAFELAMYTFHYIPNTTQVLIAVPPKPPEKTPLPTATAAPATSSTLSAKAPKLAPPARVLLFQQRDLEPELSKPLQDTLSSTAPTLKTVNGAPETWLVEHVAGRLLYDSYLTEQQSLHVLLLQPAAGA